MDEDVRCRYCLHVARWHHKPGRPDLPGDCSKCECRIWGQPPGGDPRYTTRVTYRQAMAQITAYE
jgi:hypothetical protein